MYKLPFGRDFQKNLFISLSNKNYERHIEEMLEHFPDPYPDELLYSVWARFSDHVQYPYQNSVFQELFGRRACKPIVDLPRHLNYFVRQLSPIHNLTADELIDNYTLFPYYGSFSSPEKFKHLREKMTMDDDHLSTSLPIRRYSTEISPAYLRYCPSCIRQDKIQFGEFYWHRFHQIAGVEICHVHGTFLENSKIASRGTGKYDNFISAEQAIQAIPTARLATSSPHYKLLLNIVQNTLFLLEHPIPSVQPQFLRDQYQALLAKRGFVTFRKKNIRFLEFFSAFVDYYPLELLELFRCTLPPVTLVKCTWLYHLVISTSVQHPLRHILCLLFLECDVETFFRQPMEPFLPFGKGPWPCLNPTCEYYHQRCIPTFQTVKGKREVIGKFSCTCGFTYTRPEPDHSPADMVRRKYVLAYGSLWEKSLRELWSDGTLSRADICSRLGITLLTLKYHSRALNLPIPRPSRRKNVPKPMQPSIETISSYREQWLTLTTENPQASRRALLKIRGGVGNWLYRHDREWFVTHCPLSRAKEKRKRVHDIPSQPSRAKKRSMKVHDILSQIGKMPMHESEAIQDSRVAEAVRATAIRMKTTQEQDSFQRVSIRAIVRDTPQVDRMSSHPEKFPLTERAIRESLETHEEFALRKISRTLHYYLQEHMHPSRWRFLEKAHIDTQVWLKESSTAYSSRVRQAVENAMDMLVYDT